MEICLNEYIRTKNGKIDKVINDNYYISEYIECEKGIVDKENIVNHSKNIIDLIELGDFINGNKVYKVTNTCIYCIGKAVQNKLTVNIQTILTHEQYERNCYKIN